MAARAQPLQVGAEQPQLGRVAYRYDVVDVRGSGHDPQEAARATEWLLGSHQIPQSLPGPVVAAFAGGSLSAFVLSGM